MESHDAAATSIEIVRLDRVAEAADDNDFLERALGVADLPYSVVLLSGGSHECSRYSLMGWEPLLVFTSRGNRIHIQTDRQEQVLEGDPLAYLDAVLLGLRPSYPLLVPPFCGGALGYLSYELKNCIERLPQRAHDDHGLPDILLSVPRQILVHDRAAGTLHHMVLRAPSHIAPILGSRTTSRRSRKKLVDIPISRNSDGRSEALPGRGGWFGSNFTREAYCEAIRRVRRYIREGDVYQVNLSQRFRWDFEGNPFNLWKRLYAMNPAPFYAFVQAGDHQILSTSMERFLFRQGSYLETRPIKGTRKRGATPAEDEALIRDLRHSPKDDAELSMIVDLLRNDLGRVCRARSVQVARHKQLESYQNVHHLVSIVTGRLRDGISPGGILHAMFPGGSITGCPKIRAMEIIDELEPHVRHVYTGAIGYLGWHDNIDLNVAIRTALVHEGKCYFSAGGGIVHDSDDGDEYQETLHKARTIFEVMETVKKNG
jgi:para-aminobenzoate synthetase component 1